MGSFRKRLLVLIIGLVVVTQTVTLAAVLVSTRNAVEQRAAEQLSKGGELAQRLTRDRAMQIASGVAVRQPTSASAKRWRTGMRRPSFPPPATMRGASAPTW